MTATPHFNVCAEITLCAPVLLVFVLFFCRHPYCVPPLCGSLRPASPPTPPVSPTLHFQCSFCACFFSKSRHLSFNLLDNFTVFSSPFFHPSTFLFARSFFFPFLPFFCFRLSVPTFRTGWADFHAVFIREGLFY